MKFKDLKIGEYFRFPDTIALCMKYRDSYYGDISPSSTSLHFCGKDAPIVKIVSFEEILCGECFRFGGSMFLKLDTYTALNKCFTRKRHFELNEWVEVCDKYDDLVDAVVKYCENDVIATKELFECNGNWRKFTPKKVIFNEPATIVLWGDNTKTVVKCSPNDTYDKEKGLALCYMKKLFGNDNRFHKKFTEWIKE